MLQHCLRQRTLYRRDCRPLECHELTFGIDHLLLRLSTVEYWPRASRLSVLLPATGARYAESLPASAAIVGSR
jgi:hypothetical protein